MQALEPRNVALFIDLDGTLIDIALAPQDAAAPPELVPLLERLSQRLEGGLAILTGRQLSDVDRILAPLRSAAAGVHGAEMRLEPNGEVQYFAKALDASVVEATRQIGSLDPGILIEPKGLSISVHFRLAPEAAENVRIALEQIVSHAADNLVLCPGRMVIELVPRHISKGAALERLMSVAPFRGRIPLMIGDDISDITAIDAACRLGGRGMRVAGGFVGPDEADFKNPAHVRSWLANFAERLAA